MSFFDQAYDEMSWAEVCYRLPSELAINALKRRVTNLDTFNMLMDNVGTTPAVVNALKAHVNEILDKEPQSALLGLIKGDNERQVFAWLNESNRNRIKEDPTKLSLKFLFNSTDENDESGLTAIMDKILADQEFNQAHLRSVIHKASNELFGTFANRIVKDPRPEVRACILGCGGNRQISEMQMLVGLKAFAKCGAEQPITSISVLPFTVFSELKPNERLIALTKYLDYFPNYRKVAAFSPPPSKEEFEIVLFAGCIEQNEAVNHIKEKYNLITEADPPEDEEGDEE